MNIILLSGGSGRRLWPLSNDIRSKQFIKIFKKEDGTYESMVQRVYGQIKKVDSNAVITIATSKAQVSSIHNQLGNDVNISVEPYRRDTFPAIALATVYLHEILGINENESVVVCPIDPFANDNYFKCLKSLDKQAQKGEANITLMGIQPTYPSEKYGYIIPKSDDEISSVVSFKEKPSVEDAKKYISMGALWNGGVFAYRISYLLKKAHELLDFDNYSDLFAKYENLNKISFDYAVVEKESNVQVLRFNDEWKDIGTWNTLTEVMDENVVGNGSLYEGCENVHIINELAIPILALGLHDVIISASSEGILVSEKGKSSLIKPYVDKLDQQIMFAEKSWGSYQVINVDNESLTIKVTLNPGRSMNYHNHQKRDEVWVVVSGKGETIIDDVKKKVHIGDVIIIPSGCKHTIIANTQLKLIEVQIGKDISVHDKTKFELNN